MTFLQPFLLWLLPLAALPVLIHLLNRMRFRTVHWAATSFLFSANRASTRHARVRQWLLLVCRVLALLTLILAVARPLAGGWAGWMLSSAPDVVLILVDHSASMEMKDSNTGLTRRQQALQAVSAAAAVYGTHTRFVYLENVFRTPQEIAQPALLPSLPSLGPTDSGADLPALFEAASTWLLHNRSGLAEIWIISDLQRSSWQPASSRWASVSAQVAALPERVRVRLLALAGPAAPNASITLVSAERKPHASPPVLDLTFDLQRTDPAPTTFPFTFTVDGVRSHLDLPVQGNSTRVRHSLPLDPAHLSGFGSIQLPPDGNDRDNTAWFVYSPPLLSRVALVGPDTPARRDLRLAVNPFPDDAALTCDLIDQPGMDIDWAKYALVIWSAPLPAPPVAGQLVHFIEAGGVAIFFPPPQPGGESLDSAAWGEVHAEATHPTHVVHWDARDGPLANSDSGPSLPLASLQIQKSAALSPPGDTLASLADNQPFLAQHFIGKGRAFFCTTLPDPQWSTLGDGGVLVPMLQRLLQLGQRRFSAGDFANAGDASLLANAAGWTSVDPARPHDIRYDAGVYRQGSRLLAVNRPADEDDQDHITPAAARQLFSPLAVQAFEQRDSAPRSLQGEIWRALLFAMLAFLIGESFLSLPPAAAGEGHLVPSASGAARA